MGKVFITSNQTATFVCPQCGNVTTADVARYAVLDKKVSVRCNCNCGHHFTVSLEKRRQYRKSTDLPGVYFYRMQNGEMDKGIMRVVDISTTGLKLRLNVKRDFQIGEILHVDFHLDDKRRTHIDKDVVVRNVKNYFIGTAFLPVENDDPSLGFYLMS